MVDHAVPAASEISDDAVLSALITPLLRQVAAGTASPALAECLRNTPCIATQQKAGEEGVRLRPAECFDPRHAALRAMLGDSAVFPLVADDQVLDGLVALGMRVCIDKDALLQVAKQLHSEFIALHDGAGAGDDEESNNSTAFSGSPMKVLAERGAALLSALDDVAQKEKAEEESNKDESSSSYWSSLLDLSFLPVLTEPPTKGLPWPFDTATTSRTNNNALLVPSLASPRKVRPQSAAWLCSASLSLLQGECSEALQRKFGWNASLPAKVLAAQLVALGHLHPSRPMAATSTTAEKEEQDVDALVAVVAQAAAQIYSQLEQQFALAGNLKQQQQKEEQQNGEVNAENAEDRSTTAAYNTIIAASLLTTGPTIWVGDGFVSPSLVALHTPTDFSPYIFSVYDVLSSHENLVKALTIPESPTAEQYLIALATMAAEYENQPLDTESSLLVALALVDGLGSVLLDPGAHSSSPRRLLEKYPGYLPDISGVLSPASTLMYNDAPWLAHQEDQKMVHQDVAAEIATALGAQSLRYHHQVENQTSERLPCPPASLVKQLLTVQADPAFLALSDILEIADAVGCHDVSIHLDARTHPSQSLLQPGLSAFQGPALCIKLGGVALSSDELCRIQSPPSNYRLRSTTCSFGCGLLVSYMVTDVIQVVSGDSFYIFDPSTTHLAMDTSTGDLETSGGGKSRPGSGASSSSTTTTTATGHAKQYRHAGTDLPRRFADQFSVWDWASTEKQSIDINKPINATLLRLPLRTASLAATDTALYKDSWTVEAGIELLTDFASTISQTLLFAENLQSISVSYQGATAGAAATAADDVVLVKEARIKLPVVALSSSSSSPSSAQSRRLHRSWCEEKDWRRAVKSTASTGFLVNLSSKFSWLGGGGGGGGSNGRDGRAAASPKKGKEEEITEIGVSRFTQHAILVRSNNNNSSSSSTTTSTSTADGVDEKIKNKISKEEHEEEHWMVSVCAGGYSSADIAADKGYTHHSFNPQAAVAVRMNAEHPSRPAVAPSPGLLAAWPLQDKKNSTTDGGILGSMPFSVAGFFALARSRGRRLVPPPPPAALTSPSAAGDAALSLQDGSSSTSSDVLGSPRETTEHVKARFNAALLKCTGRAASLLLEKLVVQNQHAECRALYSLLPLHIESPATSKSDVAVVCSQLCADAAKKRIWKLRRGDLVSLREGCVMQQTAAHGVGNGLGDLSEAARNFMQARLPLFDVPDGVKPWLEAWGVEGIRGVSAPTVRQELKSQAVSGVLASSGAFNASVAAELLIFATSDVVPAESISSGRVEEAGEGGQEEGSQSAAVAPVVNLDALRDCKGLPCLDMNGNIQQFGSKT